ncbi:hypothetical protein [Streptomyces sp. NPDC006368]|uniref:hypothetical protein n=1 Tax=Streptomyces sp. NPDC006368 TaxID=3156760 RepID=UPI0033A244DC
MNKIRRALAVAATAASALVLTSSPASAAPNWQSWVPTTYTKCGETTPSKTSDKVVNQTCMLMNQNGSAQGVLLVRNNASVSITVDTATVYWLFGDGTGPAQSPASCGKKVLVPGELAACYGVTVYPAMGIPVQSSYMYNGIKTITKPVYY